MRSRGPGPRPRESMALRTAVSAEPAPSVPMSRSAVKPAIRSALAAAMARMVRSGTDSSTVCRSSAPGCRNRCTCASIKPGSKVRSPRSITSAVGGCATVAPTSTMRSPVTSTSPGWSILPDSTSSRRAARSTMGVWPKAAPATSSAAQNRNVVMMRCYSDGFSATKRSRRIFSAGFQSGKAFTSSKRRMRNERNSFSSSLWRSLPFS